MTSSVITVPRRRDRADSLSILAERASSILVLGHGAGGGVGAADLELLARSLPALGTTVVRFEQPWRTAGRSVGAPPPRLDEAWLAALSWLVEQEWAEHPLVVGGRSAGARVACRTASKRIPPRSCASRSRCISQAGLRSPALQSCWPPLHRGWSCRAPRTASAVQTRFVPRSARPGITVVDLPGADHGYRIGSKRDPQRASEQSNRDRKSVTFTPADLRTTVVSEVSGFIGAVAGISTS